MKIKLITFSAISALSLGSFAFAQHPKGGDRHSVLEQRTERLNHHAGTESEGPTDH